MQAITTAVLPVAGLGTRFLPATKASPKEMLPLVDRPLIQYVVDEAVAAGIKRLVFVTSYTKRSIEDYFDSNFELEHRLEKAGKLAALDDIKNILPADVTCVFIRQANPLGLGNAILCAKDVVMDEPFVVLLADDVLDEKNKGDSLRGMMDVYAQTQSTVLAVEQVPLDKTDQYGMVKVDHKNGLAHVNHIVEKPSSADAPSNLGVIGRYILTPAIFKQLQKTKIGVGSELQLTDAIAGMLTAESVCAYSLNAQRFDCGNRLGFLQAYLHYSMKQPELRAYIEQLVTQSEEMV